MGETSLIWLHWPEVPLTYQEGRWRSFCEVYWLPTSVLHCFPGGLSHLLPGPLVPAPGGALSWPAVASLQGRRLSCIRRPRQLLEFRGPLSWPEARRGPGVQLPGAWAALLALGQLITRGLQQAEDFKGPEGQKSICLFMAVRRHLPKLWGGIESPQKGVWGNSLLWVSKMLFKLPRTSLDFQKSSYCHRFLSPGASPGGTQGPHPTPMTSSPSPLALGRRPTTHQAPVLGLALGHPRHPWEFSERPSALSCHTAWTPDPEAWGPCGYTGHTALPGPV